MTKSNMRHLLFFVLLCASIVGIYQLAARFPAQWDATQNALNSLEPGSADVLKQLEGPLNITVYVTEQDAKQGDVRKLVREFIALYQRYKSDINLTFVDPVKEPEATRKSGIQGNGEMVVEFAGRKEHITTLNEQTLTSALLRLAHGKEQMLMYVSGHGERKLDGTANHDLGEFGRRLEQNGYRIASLNLTIAQDVPDNVGVLVITQPQTKLFPGETTKLLRHIERGGNVLWLLDAEPLRGLEPIAEKMDIVLTPGVVLDPAAQQMNAPADWTLGTGYAPHAITQNFDLITVFPYARALGTEDESTWERHILVEGAMNGWVSTTGAARFDKKRDIPGPVSLALALQRNVGEREQRIVVVGSGSFLSNAYSGNGGNLDLGMNMMNWLAGEERLITLAPHTAKDGALTLSKRELTVLSSTLLIVIPLLLIAMGGWLWWRRR
ncbi:MAG: ABC transporter [Gallionellaceae bacterium]|nr:MAG: ABC transporter [Gallionellaceae bacterium]